MRSIQLQMIRNCKREYKGRYGQNQDVETHTATEMIQILRHCQACFAQQWRLWVLSGADLNTTDKRDKQYHCVKINALLL